MMGQGRHIVRFLRDEAGAVMVEFAIVSAVFFLALFQLFDFGIFASTNLMAEKATQIAARVATVRPPACAGVPQRYTVGTATPPPRFGTACRSGANVCYAPAIVSCAGTTANATADEIWTRISPSLPAGVTIADLTFTYSFDPNLGYLGGPYVPMVTVDLKLPTFGFSSPIGALAAFAGGGSGFSAPDYRVISISLPGEDLALATDG